MDLDVPSNKSKTILANKQNRAAFSDKSGSVCALNLMSQRELSRAYCQLFVILYIIVALCKCQSYSRDCHLTLCSRSVDLI